MNPYIADVLQQPAALESTLDQLDAASAELRPLAARLAAGAYERIVLTGMGSSLAACYPLWYRLVQAGHAPLLVDTSELLYDAAPLARGATLLVVVSQSGESAEVVRLLDQCPGATLLAVTNTAESALARAAAAVLLTVAGAEHSVSCKTYLCALAALAVAGDALLGDAPPAAPALRTAARAVDAYLAGWERHAGQLAELLPGDGLILCARGPSLASAHYGALILKEAARVHAEALGSAQFRHGPLELAPAGPPVLVFEGAPATAPLSRRLVRDVLAAGGRALLVSPGAEHAALRVAADSPHALPLLEALPVQLLSIGLARARGIEPGQFLVGSKVTRQE